MYFKCFFKHYLLNISISGIKNIKEEVRLDFYKKTVDKNFNPEKYRIKAIYGENGSGKSALITAVKIFQDMHSCENYFNESKTQIFLDETINKTTQTFRFHCEFLSDTDPKRVYSYSMQIGKGRSGLYEIQYEILQMKNGNYAGNKYKKIFETGNGELMYIDCEGDERKIIEKKFTNLLSTHAFMSLYIGNWMKPDLFIAVASNMKFYMHITNCLGFIFFALIVYLGEEDQHELFFIQKNFIENDLGQQTLINKLLEQNVNKRFIGSVNKRTIYKISFEKYKEQVDRLTQFIKIFKPDLVSIDIDAKENGDQYVCELNLNYGDYIINKEFESTGIKKLIRLFDCFVIASNGGIVFVDEMDSNLNDVYLCKLIEYFMYYGKGQLCFTTHNLDPMSILKENRNSIDFLSSDNHLVSWTSRGNATPENCYKNGMIEDSPFNVEATDFIGILGE